MTQVQGFTLENQGGSPATIIDPNAAQTIVGATMTSKLFTMKGHYKLRGLLAGGTAEVDLFNIDIDVAGFLKITPVAAASPASQYVVHTLLN